MSATAATAPALGTHSDAGTTAVPADAPQEEEPRLIADELHEELTRHLQDAFKITSLACVPMTQADIDQRGAPAMGDPATLAAAIAAALPLRDPAADTNFHMDAARAMQKQLPAAQIVDCLTLPLGADTEALLDLPAARQCGLLLTAHACLKEMTEYDDRLMESAALLALASYSANAEQHRAALEAERAAPPKLPEKAKQRLIFEHADSSLANDQSIDASNVCRLFTVLNNDNVSSADSLVRRKMREQLTFIVRSGLRLVDADRIEGINRTTQGAPADEPAETAIDAAVANLRSRLTEPQACISKLLVEAVVESATRAIAEGRQFLNEPKSTALWKMTIDASQALKSDATAKAELRELDSTVSEIDRHPLVTTLKWRMKHPLQTGDKKRDRRQLDKARTVADADGSASSGNSNGDKTADNGEPRGKKGKKTDNGKPADKKPDSGKKQDEPEERDGSVFIDLNQKREILHVTMVVQMPVSAPGAGRAKLPKNYHKPDVIGMEKRLQDDHDIKCEIFTFANDYENTRT